jgi:hypothetical protein
MARSQIFNEFKTGQIDTGKSSSADGFGTRAHLKNDYMQHMAAAVLGIYSNSKDEAICPVYFVDSDHQKLEGANRYTLRFAPTSCRPSMHSSRSLSTNCRRACSMPILSAAA